MKKANFYINFMKEMAWRYSRHSISAFSAQMAYFFLLSVFPFLMFLYSLLGYFKVDSEEFLKVFLMIVPEDVASIFLDYIVNIPQIRDLGFLSVAVIGTLWAASKGVNALMKAMNAAYSVQESRGYIKMRSLSMFYTLVFIIAIILGLTIPSMSREFFDFISQYIAVFDIIIDPRFIEIFTLVRWLVIIAFFLLMIVSMYMFVPNKKIKFRDIIAGSFAALAGMMLNSIGFSYFVSNFTNYSVIYGSLSAIILMMIWMYFNGIILCMGAEMNSIIMHFREKGYVFTHGYKDFEDRLAEAKKLTNGKKK